MRILIVVSVKIFAQEATPTRHFEIEVSLASKIYDKNHYVEAANSDGEKGWYGSYWRNIENRPTLGYLISAGYKIKMNKTSFLIPRLSFSNLNEDVHIYEKSAIMGCYGGNVFNGVKTTKKERYYSSIALAFEKEFKGIKIENGIGISYLLAQKNQYYSYDVNTNNEWTITDTRKEFYFVIPYSTHKIGIEVIKQRLDFYVGINFLFNKELTKTYNPFATLKLNL